MQGIQKRDIDSVKALNNPPKLVLHIFLAAAILLNDKGTDWKSCREQLKNPNAYIKRIQHFDKDNVDNARMKKLKLYIQKLDDFNYEMAKKKSAAAAGVCAWVLAIQAYHENKIRNSQSDMAAETVVRAHDDVDDMTAAGSEIRRAEITMNQHQNEDNVPGIAAQASSL